MQQAAVDLSARLVTGTFRSNSVGKGTLNDLEVPYCTIQSQSAQWRPPNGAIIATYSLNRSNRFISTSMY